MDRWPSPLRYLNRRTSGVTSHTASVLIPREDAGFALTSRGSSSVKFCCPHGRPSSVVHTCTLSDFAAQLCAPALPVAQPAFRQAMVAKLIAGPNLGFAVM